MFCQCQGFRVNTETVKQHDSFVRQLEHFGGIFLLAASQLAMSDDPGEPGLLHIPGLLRAWLRLVTGLQRKGQYSAKYKSGVNTAPRDHGYTEQ